MRNKQLYRATYTTKSSQVSSALSNELQKKYVKKSVRVVSGDTIKIVRGEYRGIDGKITRVSADTSKVAIEGVKREKTRGDKFDVFVHTSNIVVTDLNGDDQWRIKKLQGKKGTPKKAPTKAELEARTKKPQNNQSPQKTDVKKSESKDPKIVEKPAQAKTETPAQAKTDDTETPQQTKAEISETKEEEK